MQGLQKTRWSAFMEDFKKALKGEKVKRETGIIDKKDSDTFYFGLEYYPRLRKRFANRYFGPGFGSY